MSLAYSSNEPGIASLPATINVEFISAPPFQLNIKYRNNLAMKTSGLNQAKGQAPTLFQIASYFEDLFPAAGAPKAPPAVRPPPFARLKLNPGKLKAVLAPVKTGERAARQSSVKRSTRLTPKPNINGNGNGDGDGKSSSRSAREAKKINFSLKAPSARSVKLAADFTDWEKSPLEMEAAGNGLWTGVIPLPPGKYSYRFIVDGQWCDDPHCTQRVPNPFGTENAVMIVT